MAVTNVEDYAEEHAIDRVSIEVVTAQAESVGMGRFMAKVGGKSGGWLRRLFGRPEV